MQAYEKLAGHVSSRGQAISWDNQPMIGNCLLNGTGIRSGVCRTPAAANTTAIHLTFQRPSALIRLLVLVSIFTSQVLVWCGLDKEFAHYPLL